MADYFEEARQTDTTMTVTAADTTPETTALVAPATEGPTIMAYPPGVSLATITIGAGRTMFGTPPKLISATVTPIFVGTPHVVHAASGWAFYPSPQTFRVENGEELTFELPHVNAEGWRDTAGNEFPALLQSGERDRGWAYHAKFTVIGGSGQDAIPHRYEKVFQPLVGQTEPFDIDLVPDGQIGKPVSAPVAVVTSIDGMTGPVDLNGMYLNAEDGAALADAAGDQAVLDAGSYTDDVAAGLTPLNGNRPIGQGELLTSVKEFGAQGDGVADDYAAIVAALNSGRPLYFPRGDYRVGTQIKRSFTAACLIGEPGARIFSETVVQPIRLDGTISAYFRDLVFETTATASNDDSYGVVCAMKVQLKNVLWEGCEFRAPNAGTNGVKIVASDMTFQYAVDNVRARNCRFVSCGRMGFEVIEHTVSPTVSIVRNVGVQDSVFADNGAIAYGIDLSFSGPLVGPFSRGNRFYRSITIGLEFAGAPESPVMSGNEFYEMGNSCHIISVTNSQDSGMVHRATIENNRSVGRSGAGARFWRLIDARMSKNILVTKGNVIFRDCQRIQSDGDVYDTDGGNYALFCESSSYASRLNRWTHARLSTGANGFSVARFSGASCVDNVVEDSSYFRTAGAHIDQITSAARNMFVRCAYADAAWKPAKTIAMIDADKTVGLTEIDAELLVFTGTLTATRNVIFPPMIRAWRVKNDTAMSLRLGAGGNTVLVPAGGSVSFALDVANAVAA